MEGHNYPGGDDYCDGFWGPNKGPNWPAWRTLKTDMMDELNEKGIFQGYSGMIYCGKYMGVVEEGHDGYCGPNNGPSCKSCSLYLIDEYHKSYEKKTWE